jgi:hypothetical protein
MLTTETLNLYTASAKVQVVNILLVNTDAETKSANLYVVRSGRAARSICSVNTEIDAGLMLPLNNVITLAAGDRITGNATGNISFVINGLIE